MKLYCPACRSAVETGPEVIVCPGCDLRYETVAGVPILVQKTTAQHEHQRNYFDAEFSRYQRYSVENWRRSFIDRIFDALGLPEQGPYLDIGVGGSGATVIEAARVGAEAVGCDLSVSGVRAAAEFAHSEQVSGTSFAVCAAERLPYGDGAFGAVSAVALLEHLDDDGEAVSEIARVLRRGGRVWVTVPHAYRYMVPLVWPLYVVHDRRIGHKRHYDEERLIGLFDRFGFRHVGSSFTAHTVKIVQTVGTLLVPALRQPTSRTWWALEEADLRRANRRWGAMQLSAVFERQ